MCLQRSSEIHRRHLPESWTSSLLLRRRHPDVHCHPMDRGTQSHHAYRGVLAACGSRRLTTECRQIDVIWFGSKSSRNCLSDPDKAIVIANETIQAVESVRVTSESISTLNSTCMRTLQRQHNPASSSYKDACGRYVVCSAVTLLLVWSPRLDYFNALLAGLQQSTTAPLQRVMNAAARLVCNLRSRDHITPALRELHWLPIAARVQYKFCLLLSEPHRAM